MPRIAAVLGVFAVISICIFVNTRRYPAVWEMVGTSSWFAQDTKSSQEDPATQANEIAENSETEEPSSAMQFVQEPLAPRIPPSLRPELSNHSNSVTDPTWDYASSDSDDYPDDSSYAESGSTETAKTQAYQGLNPGPIKVQDDTAKSVASSNYSDDYSNEYSSNYMPGASQDSEPSSEAITPLGKPDNKWPAEMSPKMKYAAKPPLLESLQQLDSERPVVPVVRPDEGKQTDAARPDSGDSSKNEPQQQLDTLTKDDKDAVVSHLPKIDPKRQPIRMSIPGEYSQQPIPVYPSTEQ